MPPIEPQTSTPDDAESRNDRRNDRAEIYRRETAAHDLIVRLCAAKNIRLTLLQEGRTGHCEIPELWTLERAVPLDAEDLEAIENNGALWIEKEIGADGLVRARRFTRGGGWTVYETEK